MIRKGLASMMLSLFSFNHLGSPSSTKKSLIPVSTSNFVLSFVVPSCTLWLNKIPRIQAFATNFKASATYVYVHTFPLPYLCNVLY